MTSEAAVAFPLCRAWRSPAFSTEPAKAARVVRAAVVSRTASSAAVSSNRCPRTRRNKNPVTGIPLMCPMHFPRKPFRKACFQSRYAQETADTRDLMRS